MQDRFFERINDPCFKAYTELIDDTIEAYKEEITNLENSEKNKVRFTGYAVDRTMIHELERLKLAPLRRLKEIQIEFANAGQKAGIFDHLLKKVNKILGITTGE